MGNGLRRAISNERWSEVRTMLDSPHVQSRIKFKIYKATIGRGGNDRDGGEERVENVKVLHLVLIRRVPLDIVNKILEIDPGLSTFFSRPTRELPLHFAVRFGAAIQRRPEIIDALAEANPMALSEPNFEGRIPLHLACQFQRSVNVVRKLKELYPPALEIRDGHGLTPWEVAKKHIPIWRIWYRHRIKQLLRPEDNEDGQIIERPRQQRQQQPRQQRTRRQRPRPGRNTEGENREDDDANGANESGIEVVNTNENYVDDSASSIVDDDGDDDSPNAQQTGLCVLCWDGKADHVLIPCGHICLCSACCRDNLYALRNKCPVCNKLFNQRPIRVFQAGVVAHT